MRRALTFVDGIGLGFGLVGLAALLYFAFATGTYLEMYSQMGPGARLPALTKIVASPVWHYGVPVGVIGSFVAVLAVRPHPAWTVVLAVVAVFADVIWFAGLYAPIWQLAGNIGQ